MGKVFVRHYLISWYKSVALFVICLFCYAGSVCAQSYRIDNSPSLQITDYSVLPDRQYTISQVAQDSTLVFERDSLRPGVDSVYWVKINVTNPYPNNEPYRLWFAPILSYTLYAYDTDKQNWIASIGGIDNPAKQRRLVVTSLILHHNANTLLYLRINLSRLKDSPYAIRPVISLEKEVVFTSREDFMALSYFICFIVLVSFTGYNLYIYLYLKDRTYLYYVIVQIGALMFFTGQKFYTNYLTSIRIYNSRVLPDHNVINFDLNNLFEHLGVTILMWGFIRFTQSYLRTKELFPVCHKLLTWLSFIYVAAELVPVAMTITGLNFISNIVLVNGLIVLIILACIATGIVALRYRDRAAKHYLASVLLPALFAAGASVYILFTKRASPLLPETAILSQILTFAVALVARIKVVNDDLKAEEIKAIQLESDMKLATVQQKLIEEENKNITLNMKLEKEKNEELQQTLEVNQRELVGNSLYIHQKNKILSELKAQVQDINDIDGNKSDALKNIKSALSEGMYLDDEWNKFKIHFERVHPRFFKELTAAHPNLTKYELRLYAYFHINMSTKEIATLLNIAPASVRQAKTRLNKKMMMS